MSRTFTVTEVAAHVEGTVLGDPDCPITGIGSLADARPGDLVYIDSPRHLDGLKVSRAAAVICPDGIELPPHMSGIRVKQPGLAMAEAIDLILPAERTYEDVSPQAFIGSEVELAPDVGIGPLAYVGDRVKIGRGTEVHPGATIGRGTTIGEDCIIYSGVHIYAGTMIGSRVILHSGAVIGADGFGFVQEKVSDPSASKEEPLRHRKMRQVGRVVIEDDVEVGANAAIDRAAFHETRIGRGTKIDDLVMIGHNCVVGRHSVIVAQAGISGSTVMGDYVTIAGQAGLAGHLKIGSRAVVGAQSGVTKDVGAGQIVLGSPAIDARHARKALTLIDSLPEFKKTLSAHEKRIAGLEELKEPRRPEAAP
ncbi:MAG TPA: UDP-3-O-(3-hydroxymyristoyl)glucosamine N-acyltransferase [Planctomycetota bacterium]|nr:UDP-3-O-(3-hydroxymyristoyl)glucosamine N-acyltransferase [Planctomycetota bacterium]